MRGDWLTVLSVQGGGGCDALRTLDAVHQVPKFSAARIGRGSYFNSADEPFAYSEIRVMHRWRRVVVVDFHPGTRQNRFQAVNPQLIWLSGSRQLATSLLDGLAWVYALRAARESSSRASLSVNLSSSGRPRPAE